MPKKAAQTTNNKSELTLLLKSIDRRMQDFEEAVQDLKEMKGAIGNMEIDIESKKKSNEDAVRELERDFETNLLRTIQTKAQELNKIIMSTEEWDDIKNENISLRAKYNNYVKDVENSVNKRIAEQVNNAKHILQLEHERENAKLVSEIESYKKSIASMESLMNRMSQELESQKNLTAEIAKSNQRTWSQSDK